jgi:hypothetical protein
VEAQRRLLMIITQQRSRLINGIDQSNMEKKG